MTINKFLDAIAAKLRALYPDKVVYFDEIPAEADGNFYIRCFEHSQERGLDRRRKRTLQFEVNYFCMDRDNLVYNDWAETMYDNFEQLTVVESEGKTRGIALTNLKAIKNKNTEMFQFLFDATFHFVLAPEDDELMGDLELIERVNRE